MPDNFIGTGTRAGFMKKLVISSMIDNTNPVRVMASATDITERKNAELAIRESEEKYRILFRDSPDAYLIISEGVFIDCNRAAK